MTVMRPSLAKNTSWLTLAQVIRVASQALFVIWVRRYLGAAQFGHFAFAFVLAGIIFGEERIVGYGLMGVGVVLAIVDIVNRSRAK